MDDDDGAVGRTARFVRRNAWWIVGALFLLHVHSHIWADLHREAQRHTRKAQKCLDDDEFYAMYEEDCTDAIIAANKWTFLNAVLDVVTLCWLEDVFSSWLSTSLMAVAAFLLINRLVPGAQRITTALLRTVGIIGTSTSAPQPSINIDFGSLLNASTTKHNHTD